MEVVRNEQAATEPKIAHDAAIPAPQKKRRYCIVNQRLAQFKQEYVCGDRRQETGARRQETVIHTGDRRHVSVSFLRWTLAEIRVTHTL